MLHLGLLITKDDDEIIGPWFRENAHYFDEIVCLDGSASSLTKQAAAAERNVVYVHERDCASLMRTDHGLRSVAHRILIERHRYKGWITICHADEFFYHDPRKCCQHAESLGCDGLFWFALHFLPHPSELPHREYLRTLPAHLRFRYYHWDYEGSGLPWKEFRSFRNSTEIAWQPEAHGSAQPLGCKQIADFYPAYRHFKVFSLDPSWYSREPGWTRFAHHWQEVDYGQTGLNWTVNSVEDLFVDCYLPYERCDSFNGMVNHPWSIGEEFRYG